MAHLHPHWLQRYYLYLPSHFLFHLQQFLRRMMMKAKNNRIPQCNPSYGQSGRYGQLDYPEQKTPKESHDIGMVRVTHPHHPLYNQIVKVLRRAGHPAYPEQCYLIELPDGTRANLPTAWTTSVTGGEASELTSELWAEVSQYLSLAALVDALSSSVAEEVACEEQTEPVYCASAARFEQQRGEEEPAELGGAAPPLPAGINPGTGGPAGAAARVASLAGGVP